MEGGREREREREREAQAKARYTYAIFKNLLWSWDRSQDWRLGPASPPRWSTIAVITQLSSVAGGTPVYAGVERGTRGCPHICLFYSQIFYSPSLSLILFSTLHFPSTSIYFPLPNPISLLFSFPLLAVPHTRLLFCSISIHLPFLSSSPLLPALTHSLSICLSCAYQAWTH
jgi:hypothetical protein